MQPNPYSGVSTVCLSRRNVLLDDELRMKSYSELAVRRLPDRELVGDLVRHIEYGTPAVNCHTTP